MAAHLQTLNEKKVKKTGKPFFSFMGGSAAFTLSELMIVVALIAVMGIFFTKFDFNKQTEIEKTKRVISKFESVFRSAKSTAITGRTTITGNCADFVVNV